MISNSNNDSSRDEKQALASPIIKHHFYKFLETLLDHSFFLRLLKIANNFERSIYVSICAKILLFAAFFQFLANANIYNIAQFNVISLAHVYVQLKFIFAHKGSQFLIQNLFDM